MRTSLAAPLLAAAVCVGLLAGCGSDGGDAGQTTPSVTQVGAESSTTAPAGTESTTGTTAGAPEIDSVVAASVHTPTVLTSRPGDGGHLWVAERAGRVRRMAISDEGNTLTPAADYALDISDQTTTESERGLLGLTFSPDGKTMYVSFTNSQGNSRVVSYAMDGNEADASTAKTLFAVDQPYPNHNGGNIAFGPDGKLWLGLGDGGSSDDPENRAQNPSTPLGKILRIDPASAKSEIVVSGVRNPWRWWFDTDGSLWIGDVGQNHVEEIDHLPAGKIDGANLGWSGYEGKQPYLDGPGRRPADAIPPVFEYTHDGGNCSITGGFVYHGKAIPQLDGAYLFADYCAGRLRAITVGSDDKLDHEYDLGIDIESPISFGEDQQGEPYVLSEGGNIVRLIQAS
ncbi:PQQ-dependent sugar dehydrogenase [Aquihabitans sp. McL0605]|uniref:PQQ-dependent sugar dehydrogenase n=1 Tax=Aquihabitans sp. McL0605 TaxID=3415671 RepID=UPI003CF9CF8D